VTWAKSNAFSAAMAKKNTCHLVRLTCLHKAKKQPVKCLEKYRHMAHAEKNTVYCLDRFALAKDYWTLLAFARRTIPRFAATPGIYR
jgi:hypothetical protein